jgi:hypothetical protein
MTRSDEAEWWFNAVYAAVQEIPHGKVTSYGHVATLLGKRKWGCSAIILLQCSIEMFLTSDKAERPRSVFARLHMKRKQLTPAVDKLGSV